MKHDTRRVLGVDIGGTSVKLGILDPVRGLCETDALASFAGDPDGMIDRLAEAIRRYRPDLVGVGTAGAVDSQTGLVAAGNLRWYDVPLRKMLTARLGLPVWVDNDAHAAMTAEWYDGALKGLRSAIYLTLGTGIGGAMLIDGRPWRGHTNTAGELGHIITHADGLVCSCSRRGCLEMYASASALSRMAGGQTPRAVIDAARAGDAHMSRIFDAYLHELAIGLTSIIVAFRPEAIALGGGISAAGDILLEGIRRELAQQFGAHNRYVSGLIRLAHHRNDAGMIGAAVLARLNL